MSFIGEEVAFSQNDYREMKFNVMSISPNDSVLAAFPILSRFQSFNQLKKKCPQYNLDKIIRYICLAYDPKSPAVQTISDKDRCKSWCGVAAGFPFEEEEGVFDSEYYKVLNCEVVQVNRMILDFISMFNNPDYELLCIGYENYYKTLRQLNEEVDDLKKNDLEIAKMRNELYKQARLMGDDLRKLANSILGDYNPYLREHLYRTITERIHDKLFITPESRAKMRGEL